MLKQFRDLEWELAALDEESWCNLKIKAAQLLRVRSAERGWQALFDTLNEAKAYSYLSLIGCTCIRCHPQRHGVQTPDWQADFGGRKVLCEVKTINISQDEARRRTSGSVGKTQGELPDEFLTKLKKTIEGGTRQIKSVASGAHTYAVIYIVINFDDSLNQYVHDYITQLTGVVIEDLVFDVEDLVFDVKPPFYSAMGVPTPWEVVSYHREGADLVKRTRRLHDGVDF